LNDNLENEKWDDIYIEENPQRAYTKFYKKLYCPFGKSIPLVTQSDKQCKASQTPWVTKGILVSRKGKDKLYRKFIKNPNETCTVLRRPFCSVHKSIQHTKQKIVRCIEVTIFKCYKAVLKQR